MAVVFFFLREIVLGREGLELPRSTKPQKKVLHLFRSARREPFPWISLGCSNHSIQVVNQIPTLFLMNTHQYTHIYICLHLVVTRDRSVILRGLPRVYKYSRYVYEF